MPSESNRVWIGGRPIEEWLGARACSSPCCAACGDLARRTMELDGQTYEAIAEDLNVKAAHVAAARLDGTETSAAKTACRSTGCGCR